MVFSSPLFLFLFLPVVVALYFASRQILRNAILLAASLLFYAWGEPVYILLMLYSTAMNYGFGMLVEDYRDRLPGRWILGVAITANLALLFYYKYFCFALASLGSHASLLAAQLAVPDSLPVGISFYTFHAISYLVDVFRRESPAQRNPLDLGLYIAFFPQLIAGPIIRYHDIAEQLRQRHIALADINSGALRFTLGLAKKVLLANTCGQIADSIFALPAAELSPQTAWLGILAYTLQLYFDFSGYSDMAIGLARLFGFRFLENFNYPYIANSIQDFWRRWHISLSRWFRDYLYIPLGGNRLGAGRTYLNLLIVFFVTGLWHGANWTFIVWGLFHGAFLIAERIGAKRLQLQIWPPLRHLYVWLIVMTGWVFFRADSLDHAGYYLYALSAWHPASPAARDAAEFLTRESVWAMGLACVLTTPVYPWLTRRLAGTAARYQTIAQTGLIGLVLFAVALKLAQQTYNPFIYFRF